MPRFERWLEVKAICEQALGLSMEERTDFLERACAKDSELRQEVELLLSAPALPTSAMGGLLGLSDFGADPELSEGDVVDHLVIVRLVKHGGMSVVYEARDTRNANRRVALKVLTSRSARIAQDKRLAGFSAPSIVTFHDSGETAQGLPYFVFEYIDGDPITAFCDRRRLSLKERLHLFRKVCDAVSYAHQRFVVHCDLKPDNILVTATGELKLLDFGIAREEGGREEGEGRTQAMTLPFASPEQVGNEATTTLSDVYSLGVLLCVLLTGRLPYRNAKTIRELRDAIVHGDPVPPSELIGGAFDPGVATDEGPFYCAPPPELSWSKLVQTLKSDLDFIVLQALRKEPGRRYAFAADLSEDIRRYLAREPVCAHPKSPLYRLRKLLHRRAVVVSIGGVAAAVFLSMALLAAGQYRRAVRGERLATAQSERTRQVNRFVVDLLRRTNPFDPSGSANSSVDELLDQSTRTIGPGLTAQPDLKASLLSVLGEIFLGRENLPRAQQVLEDALSIQRKMPPDRSFAETLYRYGVVLTYQGRFQESEDVLDEAEKTLADLVGTSDELLQARVLMVHASNQLNLGNYDAALSLSQAALRSVREAPESFGDLASSLHGLGRMFEVKGRDREAEVLLRQALSFSERIRDREHPQVAITLNSLGALMQKRGSYAEAREGYKRALEINRKSLGDHSMAYALTLHNLAALDSAEGRYREALDEFSQVVSQLRESLGPRHLRVLTTRGQLVSTLIYLNRKDEAERALLDLLDDERAALPKGHPLTASTQNNLAFLYQDQGRLEEAEVLYRGVLEDFSKLLGRKSRPVATILGNLGAIAQAKEKRPEAEARYTEALSVSRSLGGEKDPDTFNALANLASLYIIDRRFSEARPLILEATNLAGAISGPSGRLSGSAIALNARLLLAQGDFTNALDKAKKAREILSASLPLDDWRIASMDSVIGASLGQGAYTPETERLLVHSLSQLQKTKGDSWPMTREAKARVHSFYKRWGRLSEARKYRS